MNSIHRSFARTGLIRDTDHRILGGVCSGLGRRYAIDPWAVRLLLVISLLAIPGSQFLLYPLAWILMPNQDKAATVLSPALPAAPVNLTKTAV